MTDLTAPFGDEVLRPAVRRDKATMAPERDVQGIVPLNEKEAAIQRWTVTA